MLCPVLNSLVAFICLCHVHDRLLPLPLHSSPPIPLQNMGMARVTCQSGCKCKASTIDATWYKPVSLMQIHWIKVGTAGGIIGEDAQSAFPALPLLLPASPHTLVLRRCRYRSTSAACCG